MFEQVSESALDLVPATGFFASSALELVEAANTSTNPNPNPKPNPDANPNQVSAADDASAARDVDVMPFQAGDRVRIVAAVTVGQQGRRFDARSLLGTVKVKDRVTVRVRVKVKVRVRVRVRVRTSPSPSPARGLLGTVKVGSLEP